MREIIRLEQVYKRYFEGKSNELQVLSGIDLSVNEGEFVAIVGESGSGKSTIMNILGLLDRPSEGRYLLGGVDIQAQNEKTLSRTRGRRIGFVFQTFNLIGRTNARRNVEMPMLYARVPARERTRRAKELLEMVGMADRMKHQPNELSGGQKQRVAIARALAVNPEVLFCDEATSSLDPQTTRSILALIRDLQQRLKITVVLITHQMEVIREICHEVAVLEEGVIVEQGSVASVFDSPQSAAARELIHV